MGQLSSPVAAPLESWLGPDHFPATRSGLIGRAHVEGAPLWVLSLLRDLPPDGCYYQNVDQLVEALTHTVVRHAPARPQRRTAHAH